MRLSLLAALFAALGLSGCGIPQWWMGARQGTLFQGMDAVTPLGQPTTVWVSLRGGELLSGLSDYTVFFEYERQVIGVVKTDPDGIARLDHTFDRPGLHRVTARLDPEEIGVRIVPSTRLLVEVLPREQKLILVDIDKTIVASDFDQVLLSEAAPAPGSQQVLRQLDAGQYSVILITGRLQQFMRRTRQWLDEHEYPPLPLLVKSQEQLLLSPADFKRERVAELRRQFPNLEWGVEDRVADAKAFSDLGLRVVLLVSPEDFTAGGLDRLAAELEQLPPHTQVVLDWPQVQRAILGQESFPRDAMQAKLRDLAQQKARRQEQAEGRP